jgi:hypothetical protein
MKAPLGPLSHQSVADSEKTTPILLHMNMANDEVSPNRILFSALQSGKQEFLLRSFDLH